MLKLKDIKKRYGRRLALSGLDLQVPSGALYGLVGPNGAGKTTLMKVMAGLLSPDGGTLTFEGIDLFKERKRAREVLGYVPDSFGMYENMTVEEYMLFFASANGFSGLSARKKIYTLLEQVNLSDKTAFYLGDLSRGMQQRLCVARSLIHDPLLIIMDEPSSGLDPRTRFEFKEMILDLHEAGKTIILSSHILSELSEMCTDIGIIEKGKMVISGDVESILSRVEGANPIKIKILWGAEKALQVFRSNSAVTSVSVSGEDILVRFEGDSAQEAGLLQELVAQGVEVREFVREPGSLESFFMKITDHSDERVIFKNDY